MGNLAGKVAIVTGSSRGIGRAIAERFAADGAAVVVNYNRSADEAREVVAGIEERGGKAAAIQGDASAVADIRRLFRDTIARFAGVDIVVNNAGPSPDESGAGAPKPLAEITEKEFDAYINGFARGPFFVMQEAARNLRDNGRIINISSVISDLRPPFAAPYAGAKSALEAFSDALAQELAPRRITVNVIAPGGVETRMLRALPGEVQGMLAERTPLGIGKPSDIAGIAAFLASEEGTWITAGKYRIDGGIR
jgi:3-oxoacyl-[acyl-carrier protein] reductase